jgi:hypothetical protein
VGKGGVEMSKQKILHVSGDVWYYEVVVDAGEGLQMVVACLAEPDCMHWIAFLRPVEEERK